MTKGSSLIGDGLASCAYSFSNLEEDKFRTRIIIFSTDNALEGTPLVDIQTAADICKEQNITVFAIAPKLISTSNEETLKMAVEKTGGNFYMEGSGTTSSIINNIEQKSKSLIEGQKETKKIDKPQIPFIFLIASLIVLFLLNKKVNL